MKEVRIIMEMVVDVAVSMTKVIEKEEILIHQIIKKQVKINIP